MLRGFVPVWLVLCACAGPSLSASDLKLWYESPASEWIYSLPVGNGRLLATNQGGVRHEVVQLNEDTVWSGGIDEDRDKPGAYEALQEARQLLFAGEYKKAELLVNEKLLTPHHAHGAQTYQTLGALNLFFEYGDKMLRASEYRRELDLDTAVSSVSYKMSEAGYTRELFSSPVDQVIVLRLSSDHPGGLRFDAIFDRIGASVETKDNRMIISGTATDLGNPDSGGVNYAAQIEVRTDAGQLSAIKDGIRVAHAKVVEIRMVAATNFRGDNPRAICEQQISAIRDKSFASIKQDHLAEHQRLFRRVELNLPQTARIKRLGPYNQREAPTDQRIEALRQGLPDPELIALYFQFGRYLLISSSRPGTQAINLWGKWIDRIDPWYNMDYHANINIPMNYWPAQVTNLPECHAPFFDLIDELRPQGRVTAHKTYRARGFVAHHATDAWRYTAAVGRATHGMWSMTPAWGAIQMWQHYLFTEDRDYLAEKSYPVIKEAAEFIVDYLVEDPRTGYLTTGPSNSPENTFIAPNGDRASISMGPAMDLQLVEALFRSCIEASQKLDIDEPFRNELEQLKSRLQPLQVGEDGRLMEWSLPFEETEPGHKHVSHLWAVCEGDLINPIETPELAVAAHKSLDHRVEHGSAQTPVFRGNTAWIIQSYARLHAGEDAYQVLRYLIADSSYSNLFAISVQGLRRKMWETDANLGATSAIAEMLLQSQAGSIHLLPALPAALHTGSVKGLRAQGGFEIDMEWKDGELQRASVRSLKGNICILRLGDKVIEFETEAGQEYSMDGALAAH